MKKWIYRIQKLSVRVYLSILFCLIVPVFLTFIMISHQYELYIQDQLSEQIISSISKSEEAVYTSFRNLAGISSAIVTNQPLLNALKDEEKSYYEINKIFDECLNYTRINNLFMSEELLITMFDRQGRCYTNWNRNFHDYRFLLEQEWIKHAANGKGHLAWNLNMPAYQIGDQDAYISAAQAIYDSTISEKTLGVVIISMAKSQICQALAGYCYDQDDSAYMFGSDGKLILSYALCEEEENLENVISQIRKDRSGSFRTRLHEREKLVSYYTLAAPWKLGEEVLYMVHITDFEAVKQQISQFSRRMKMLIVGAMILTLAVAGVFVNRMVKPVHILAHIMRHYNLGESMEGLDMERRDEIGHLNRSFKKLTDNMQEQYKVREQYRYKVLRSQLNPHFLFNTLNSIRYMAMMQHADGITEGIDALAKVLKYTLGKEGEESTLGEEIAHVEGYLAIQNMRFGKQIQLEKDFDADVTMVKTPRFILQPVVENAVIHAFRNGVPFGQTALIRLYGFVEDDTLHFYVEDNGGGVEPEMLENLNHGKQGKMTGIGFSNVKQLIELTYGNPYTVEIQSQPDIGTVVHYCLPAIEKQGDTEHEKSADC